MNRCPLRVNLALLLLGLTLATRATGGAVATSHPLATQAGHQVLQAGGNAMDAAVAVALTLGVVDGHNSGIGGGCFLLLVLKDGTVTALDGRETAPAGLRPEMYFRDGSADVRLSQEGALAPGVPGALAVYDHVAKVYGRQPLRDHLRRAAQLAWHGFPIDATFAARLAASAEELRAFPQARDIFLREDGSPRPEGEILRQTDLARTYRMIAREGIDWFYRGPVAARAERWMKDHGGVMTSADFASYQFRRRTPLRSTYRDCEIIGFPPPSSGGVHVAEILNILEAFDLRNMGADSVDYVHVVTEAMKRAFADRAHWLGDPAFAPVPRGLLDKGYAARLAGQIRLDRASDVKTHGIPEGAESDLFDRHTTHFSVADDEGNWVAGTATLNLSFGSKVVIPGTGVVLNNQMDDFSLQPGVPNAFGLVGAEANAVVPGKRPLSSMSPTVVCRGGKPILAVGAAGGPTIISQTLLTILQVVDFHRPLAAALAEPRFHHQWKPDHLVLERALADRLGESLAARGHRLRVETKFGACQAVAREGDSATWAAVADPRGHGAGRTLP